MRINRKTLSRPATVVASVGLLLGGVNVPTASAAVPSCVAKSVSYGTFTETAKATNNCAGSQSFYFLWDFHQDGGCSTLRSGYWRSETVAISARFAGLASC
ncbi:hypothetical protein [Streptomyces sp. NPDC055749]